MISRAHGLVLSVLLGTAAATGAYALVATAHLGDAETKPEVVSSRQIAQRARKLDAWEVSLRKTLKAKPPALPPLNRYAAVTFVAAPGTTTLPAPVSVSRRLVQQTKSRAQPAAKSATKVPPKRRDAVATPIRDDAPEKAAPVRSAADPTPAPSPVVAVAAAAPATTPAAAASTPPATLSVEQQCRQLLRAAEGKSEQVKQEAERQCEALKQAAERKG